MSVPGASRGGEIYRESRSTADADHIAAVAALVAERLPATHLYLNEKPGDPGIVTPWFG